MNPVDLNELFRFNETEPLDKTIEKVTKLNNVLDLLVSDAQKNAKKYADALATISSSVDVLEKSIEKLDVTNKKDQEALTKSAKSLDNLTKENLQYNESLKTVEKELISLVAAQQKLETSKNNLAKLNQAEVGSVTALKQQLKDAVKDYENLGKATDNSVKKAHIDRITELSKAVKESDKAVKDAKASVDLVKGSYNELSARVAAAKKQLKDFEGGIGSTSKEFKNLQKFVKDGTEQLKAFDKAVGDHRPNVGNYQSALEGLDGVAGGVIGRFKALGQQLLALISNPVVAFFAAVTAAVLALNNAVNTYYETTADGEKMMEKRKATWDAFFLTLRQGWADVGKSVSDALGDSGLRGFLASILFSFAPALAAKFLVLEQMSQKLADTMRKLARDHIKDVIDDANTEVKANALLEVSRDKLNKTADERLAALREHNRLRKEQLAGDLQLAKDDIAAEVQRLQLLGRRVDGQKLISEMTDEELNATGLMKGEVESLGKLQAALLKVQSDASAQRISLLKLEKALNDEIHKEKMDDLKTEFETSIAVKQAEVDKAIMLVQEEVIAGRKTKADGDKEIAYIRKAIADDLIQAQIDGLNKILSAEILTAEERAEVEKALAKLKVDLSNAVYDQVIELDAAIVKSGKSSIEILQEAYEEFANVLTGIFGNITDARLQDLEREQEALDERSKKEIQAAGDNDAAKKKIEEQTEARRQQLEKKIAAEKRKQAAIQKAADVVQAGILTAKAILAALAGGPPPFNLGLAVITAAAAAAQTAVIAAAPLPQYAEGTQFSAEGPAIVNEKGPELIVSPSGKARMYDTEGAMITHLERDSKVFPHDSDITQRVLNDQELDQNTTLLGDGAALMREYFLERDELARSNDKNFKNLMSLIAHGDRTIEDAITNKRDPDYYDWGALAYRVEKRRDGSSEALRAKIYGG